MVSTIRFLATDFNTGTTTVSLNYTLQISPYYNTHKVFSSQPSLQLHGTALNSDASVPQFNSYAPKLICCQAGVSKLNWFVDISSQSSSTTISKDSLNSLSAAWDPHYISLRRPQQKTPCKNNSSTVIELCFLRSCIETVDLLLRACSFSWETFYRVVA
jgi:hypothetical protein